MRKADSLLIVAAGALLCALAAPASFSADDAVLKVCADPNNLPQSDEAGRGYENKIAEAMARDMGRRVEYTFFPQRMGFVRNTLRSQNERTKEYKCDVIIGVPKGYELTATTRPYMRSIYSIVMPSRADLESLASAEDLLTLPPETLRKLRFGIFAQTPAADWLLRNGLLRQARVYPAQSGDPAEHPASVIERDLETGEIDVAIVWGPVAGFLADRHKGEPPWLAVPFRPDPQIRFDFEIAMGVRFGENEWKNTLDQWIATHQDVIRDILTSYRVPMLETSATKLSAMEEQPSAAETR